MKIIIDKSERNIVKDILSIFMDKYFPETPVTSAKFAMDYLSKFFRVRSIIKNSDSSIEITFSKPSLLKLLESVKKIHSASPKFLEHLVEMREETYVNYRYKKKFSGARIGHISTERLIGSKVKNSIAGVDLLVGACGYFTIVYNKDAVYIFDENEKYITSFIHDVSLIDDDEYGRADMESEIIERVFTTNLINQEDVFGKEAEW